MLEIKGIPAFSDNYLWCLHDDKNAVIVDPGCAKSVETYLKEHSLNLVAILITHHHPDHIGGVKELKEKYAPVIYGFGKANFDFLDIKLAGKDSFDLMGINFKVLEVPGHTLDHIAYFAEIPIKNKAGTLQTQASLFCGDTLFSAGCGRLFEGTAEQMLDSLNTIKALPADTLIYCAHEYTLSNLKFAKELMPSNQDLNKYILECQDKRKNHLPTIPTVLATELAINPFLRQDDTEIITYMNVQGLIKNTTPVELFRAVRKAKDNF